MSKLTRNNPKTWVREDCSLKQWLLDGEFYDHSDRGQIERLENTVQALEKTILILVDFLEEKHGEELVRKFTK